MTATRREVLLAGAAGVLGLAAAGCGGNAGSGGRASATPHAALAGEPIEDRLIMGNWVDFTSPVNLKEFSAEFGVDVTQSGYGSEEELIAKMRTGGFKFDIVVPGTGGLEQMGEAGLLMELDRSLLPNLEHLAPAFAGDGRLAPDPRYGVAKDYGIASFFWRTEVVDDPPRTIAEAFAMLGRHRDARVNVIESSNELIALALAALGVSINSERDEDLVRARDLLIAAKPSIDTISTQYIERGQRGEIDIGIGYSGDVRRIRQGRAEDRRRGRLPDPGRTDRGLRRRLGDPGRRAAPGRRTHLDQLRAGPAQRRPRDRAHPVRQPGDGIEGHLPEQLAETRSPRSPTRRSRASRSRRCSPRRASASGRGSSPSSRRPEPRQPA